MQPRLVLIIGASLVAACSSDSISGTSGRRWLVQVSGTTQGLTAVWGTSASDVFAVGQGGTILHYDGTSWSAQASGTSVGLVGVWGSSPTDVFAVGGAHGSATILHFDGATWSPQSSGAPSSSFFGVWGASARDMFVVGAIGSTGAATILRYDGTAWTAETLATEPPLFGVWGTSSTNVIAVGPVGSVMRYRGTSWTRESGIDECAHLGRVWGSSANDVFAVGVSFPGDKCHTTSLFYPDGVVLHYDGARWATVASPALATFNMGSVWGTSPSDVFAVGSFYVDGGNAVRGAILYSDGSGWRREPLGTVGALTGIWGTEGEVFAVGANGLILRGSR